MKRMIAAAAALAAGGCAAGDPPQTVPPAPGMCQTLHAARFVGKVYGAAMEGEVKSWTGATSIRVLPPGAAATMDYREDRVNLDVDAAGRILAVRCG
ncbi:I78 family peptidase inhibitor [Sphingomonas sp. CJ20]